MEIADSRRRGTVRVAFAAILMGLAAGCAQQQDPAPVYQRGAMEPIVGPMPAPPPALQVIVRRGQTLDGYAYTYHVPRSAIIAANNLRPPYALREGMRLSIPGAGGPVHQAMPRQTIMPIPPPTVAMSTGSPRPLPPPQQAAIPQPPRTPETLGPRPLTPPPPQPSQATKATPDIIPLDGPAPPRQAAAPPPPAQSAPAALSPPQQAMAPPPAAVAAPPVASADTGGGRFPWPVRGRVLATYGNMPGGGHNDGINIAAPRGTPVRAIDSGTVAYAGNEVKGYGNIVLIKHANGWISAYAHLDDVTVKPGDTIAAGQSFAKVGESGGVTEPQLHFELRRGKKPVDPKEFLAPAPSAAGAVGNGQG